MDTRSPSPRLHRLITHKFKATQSLPVHSVWTRGTDPPRPVLHTTTTQERICQGHRPTSTIGLFRQCWFAAFVSYHTGRKCSNNLLHIYTPPVLTYMSRVVSVVINLGHLSCEIVFLSSKLILASITRVILRSRVLLRLRVCISYLLGFWL